MANIAKREDGRWRARYRDARGKEYARHFARKIDAQHWIDSVTTAVRTGAYVDPNDSRIRFADWAPRWLDTKVNLKETTRATSENLLTNHVVPSWGEVGTRRHHARGGDRLGRRAPACRTRSFNHSTGP